MCRKLLQLGRADQPSEIFLGCQQHQIIGLRLGEEVKSFGCAEAMVIGKGRPVRYLDASGVECCEKFFRIGNAREGQNLASANRVDDGPIRFEPAAKKGDLAPLGVLDDACGAVCRSDHDQRLCASELQLQRSAQRSSRNDAAIADAAAAVDEDETQVLRQRRILKTIIHHDDARSGGTREGCSGDAIARDDGWREARQQNRFVTDIGGLVQRRVDAHRA
ncbi:MAG TPA: hypothetical protein VF760_03725, partial [Xanthobacteraceae bacterium]